MRILPVNQFNYTQQANKSNQRQSNQTSFGMYIAEKVSVDAPKTMDYLLNILARKGVSKNYIKENMPLKAFLASYYEDLLKHNLNPINHLKDSSTVSINGYDLRYIRKDGKVIPVENLHDGDLKAPKGSYYSPDFKFVVKTSKGNVLIPCRDIRSTVNAAKSKHEKLLDSSPAYKTQSQIIDKKLPIDQELKNASNYLRSQLYEVAPATRLVDDVISK